MEILVATHNLHKKEEIQQILGTEYIVTSLSDYNLNDEIIEDGSTFQENNNIRKKVSIQIFVMIRGSSHTECSLYDSTGLIQFSLLQ